MATLNVTGDDVDSVTPSLYSTVVLCAIDRIARGIGKYEWLSALKWSREQHAQAREDDRQEAERTNLHAQNVSETEYKYRSS